MPGGTLRKMVNWNTSENDNGVHKFQHDSGYCSGNDHILIVVDSSKNYVGKDWTELPDAQQKWNK